MQAVRVSGGRRSRARTPGAILSGMAFSVVLSLTGLAGAVALSSGASLDTALLRMAVVLLACIAMACGANIAVFVEQARRGAISLEPVMPAVPAPWADGKEIQLHPSRVTLAGDAQPVTRQAPAALTAGGGEDGQVSPDAGEA